MRISAVSYLNTSPLVWGLLNGDPTGHRELRFELPSECADSIAACRADVGLVPTAEIERQNLELVGSFGIASDGPVRSILLVSKLPPSAIRTLAIDKSSRTSAVLAKIVLKECYGVEPETFTYRPDLENMLATCDAALIIGDPALRLDLEAAAHTLDLGSEWRDLTHLPMVYAAWSGFPNGIPEDAEAALAASYRFGREHLADIVRLEAARRGFDESLARAYLTRHIEYELSDRHYRGMDLFRRMVRDRAIPSGPVPALC